MSLMLRIFRITNMLQYNKWPSTLRYPTSTRSLTAKSQENQVEAAMESQFAGLQQNVSILLNDPNYQDFAAFSNHQWQDNEPGTFASLEDIHNSIHVAVGGDGGHMSELDYSAFDPVFWLHHTCVLHSSFFGLLHCGSFTPL
jgi:tyrosinase